MSEHKTLWEKLLTARDEVSLHAHLMSMDLKDEWHLLEKKYHELEQKFELALMEKAQKLGEAEEVFFVGDTDEVEKLVEDFKDLEQKTKDQD